MKHSLQLGYLPIPQRKTDKSGWMCFTDNEKEWSWARGEKESEESKAQQTLTGGITEPSSTS